MGLMSLFGAAFMKPALINFDDVGVPTTQLSVAVGLGVTGRFYANEESHSIFKLLSERPCCI